MKTFATLFCTLLGLVAYWQQLQAQCGSNRHSTTLQGNEVRTPMNTTGMLFWEQSPQSPNYGNFTVFTDTSIAAQMSVFSANIWIGGIDNNGNLKMNAQTYAQTGLAFWPGPLDNSGNPLPDACTDFNYIWEVDYQELVQHRTDLADNGQIDNAVGASLLAWPAKGNPYFLNIHGFDLPLQDLAPFRDVDQNGQYNPYLGDYPIIDAASPDAIPSVLAWWVGHDVPLSTPSNNASLNIEQQYTIYAFDCPQDELLQRTMFVKAKNIYKGTQPLTDTWLAFWVDGELNYPDDLYGSDPSSNSIYWYTPVPSNINYPSSPPVQAVTLLNGDIDRAMLYINNWLPMGNPNTLSESYNYMRGYFSDGSPLRDTLIGYGTAGNLTNFIYPDPPSLPGGWSGYNVLGAVQDSRMLMSMPYRTTGI